MGEVGRFLNHMLTTKDIARVTVQTFEVVEEPGKETR
jgi:hypothetical protein